MLHASIIIYHPPNHNISRILLFVIVNMSKNYEVSTNNGSIVSY